MARKKQTSQDPENPPELDTLKEDFSALTIPQKKALTAFLKSNGNVSEACKAADIARAIWYHWRKTDEHFQQALVAVDDYFTDQLENAARTFAFGGDTTLIIFLLKSRRRAVYDDAYVRQERAFEKGVQPQDGGFIPVRAVLVRDEPPAGVLVNGEAKEH